MLKDQGTHEQFLQSLRKEVANAQEEVWPRAIHIASRMIQLGLDAAQVSSILSHVLEEMLAEGEWADLGQTCKVMSATMTLDNEDGAENTHLKSILERLTKEGRLLAMEARLIIATPEEFDMLIDFLKVLPEGANDTLRDLLLKMPRGEAQTKFRQLLEDRGVDLTDHYARSLNSNNQEQVMAAISVLTDMGTPEALAKIPRVFSHPSARVRLEAIKSMKGKVKPGDLADEVVGQLVGTLAASYPSLHEAAYDLIKDVPRSSRGEDLIALLEKPETASKLDSVRKFRISILLIRWGGTAVDDFIIDTICASGLFVRRKQAQLKGEMLDALERVGGDRARNLIAACRARQPAKTVRAQLDEAAKKLR